MLQRLNYVLGFGKIKTNFGYEGKIGVSRAVEVHYFYKIKFEDSLLEFKRKTPGKASWKSQELPGEGIETWKSAMRWDT